MSKQSKKRQFRWGTGLVLSVASVGICFLPWLISFELFLYDCLFWVKGEQSSRADVVIVAIDEPSFQELELQWPWPRSLHSLLLDKLMSRGARAVAFDVIFSEPTSLGDDRDFAESISKHKGKVVLAGEIRRISDQHGQRIITVLPLEAFISAGAEVGLANVPVDVDGFVRWIYASQEGMPSLTAATVKMVHSDALEDYLAFDEKSGQGGRLRINFAGGIGSYPVVDYYQAMDPDKHLPAGFFKNKVVVVGVLTRSSLEAQGRADHFPIPYTRWNSGYMSGAEIQSNAIDSILQRTYLREVPREKVVVFCFLLGLIASQLFFFVRPGKGILLLCLLLTVLSSFLIYAFIEAHLYLPILLFLMPVVAAYLASPFIHYAKTWKERNFIRRAFSMYLAPAVVNKLLKDPERLRLGGEKVEGTVLFLDIQGFTALSEQLEPEVLVDCLNTYFSEFSKSVFAHGGMIDKYIGDCVMAVWGSPVAQEDHAARCCRAALQMLALVEYRATRAHSLGEPVIKVRIGINSGAMVAGNVGGEQYFNYTVLGDEVNLASRLEGVGKYYGCKAIIGPNTRALLGEEFLLRKLDTVRVKNRLEPVAIYELQCLFADASKTQLAVNTWYDRGLERYRAGDFVEARNCFAKACEMKRDDKPSQIMYSRSEIYIREAPKGPWDGVYDLQSK